MSWPKVAPAPAPDDVVQVLMSEREARELPVDLSPPLMFSEDDVPTYIVRPSAGSRCTTERTGRR